MPQRRERGERESQKGRERERERESEKMIEREREGEILRKKGKSKRCAAKTHTQVTQSAQRP